MVIAIVGTDTDAGKTVVATSLIAALRRRGWSIAGLKPVATGVTRGGIAADAVLLASASERRPEDCQFETFQLPRAPLVAARAEGRRIDLDAMVERITGLSGEGGLDGLIVEGVGGVLVPLTEDVTLADLIRRLNAPVVIVGRAGLGTINHCALTVTNCRDRGLVVAGVILSEVAPGDPGFHRENAEQVERLCNVPVLGVLPYQNALGPAALADAAIVHLDLAPVEQVLEPAAGRGQDIAALDRAHLWHPFTQTTEWNDEHPLVIDRAEGCWLTDTGGRRYLDGIASLWANVHGHHHPQIDEAVRHQLGKVAHTTFLGQTHEPGARLAAELAAVTPPGLTRFFFSEAGAAAVEAGLRIALQTQQRRGEKRRSSFLSLEGAYHGDTAGAVSVGRSDSFHAGLDPLLFSALQVPPPHLYRMREEFDAPHAEAASLRAVEELVDRRGHELAAVVVEPRVQAAAGIWTHSDAWLRGVAELTRRSGALLICDEVATGFGRTGDLFATGGAGLSPDILILGKGLSGGYLPISATVVGDEIFELFTAPYADSRTLYYGHTFAGNPLACAAARASLRLFESEATLDRARHLADRLAHGLAPLMALPHVADVRRCGVMCGIELGEAGLQRPFPSRLRIGRRVTLAARRRGVVVRSLGDVVVINPPLVMDDAEAGLLVDTLTEAICEVGTPSS